MTDKTAAAIIHAGTAVESGALAPAPVIVDLGTAKRSQIKQLTRGEGPLTNRVLEVIDSLREEGTVGALAQPVIVVVKKKAGKKNLLGRLL